MLVHILQLFATGYCAVWKVSVCRDTDVLVQVTCRQVCQSSDQNKLLTSQKRVI